MFPQQEGCQGCPIGKIPNSDKTWCEACPAGAVPDPYQTKCQACNPYQITKDGIFQGYPKLVLALPTAY